MSAAPKPPAQNIGEVVWRDLTVADADGVRDFYAEVVGWQVQPMPMPAPEEGGEEYADYVMLSHRAGSDETEGMAGVCHARGSNADMPPVWLVYVRVADIHASCAAAEAGGGKVVHGPRSMGPGILAVVQDPAGALLGLWDDSGQHGD